MNVKAKGLPTGIEQLNVIYKKLDLISGQVIETEKKLTDKREQITSIQHKVQTLEEEINSQKDNLTMWNKKDLVMIVSKVPAIQDKLEQIKKEFQDVETVENIQQINDRIREFNTFINRLTRSFRILWQNSKGKWLAFWFFFALFIFAIYMVTAGPWKDLLSTAHRIWSGVVTFCALIVSNLYFLKPVYKKVADFYEGLKELKATVDQEKAKVELKEEHEVKKLSQQINELTSQKITLETHLAATMDEKARLETQLSDLGSGKALANFISEKSTDDEYTKQLGILSWIRKDFQKLNDLFEQQRERSLKQKSEGKLTDPPVLEIDRIVLYIDDLDRCNADTVVKVLEAINLLLAFPLFVVIVGVDPRWLKNALNNKLGELFGDGSKDSPSDTTSEELATSYDYLEKIFQIPFAIKPIDDAGGKALISQLLEGDISRPVITPVTTRNLQQTQGDSRKSDLAPMPLLPTGELHNTTETMRMTEGEMFFMQQLSPLFARSPRHVNRYVNIYRIIKSHRDLKIIAPTALDEYQIILFLLAVLVGFNSAAADFFKAILTGKGSQPIKDLLVPLKNDPYKAIGKLAAKIDAALPLATFSLFLKMLQEFRTNMDLISRFSFRMIELQEVTPENPET